MLVVVVFYWHFDHPKTLFFEINGQNIHMGSGLYGSEAWTIGKTVQKRIEAFET
jgi:hypothetical protein